MILKATDVEVVEMAKLAIMASKPMGMGYLHYNHGLKMEDIDIPIPVGDLSIDYWQGRMVKFYARRAGIDWNFMPDVLDQEYQSWCVVYKDYSELLRAAQEIART